MDKLSVFTTFVQLFSIFVTFLRGNLLRLSIKLEAAKFLVPSTTRKPVKALSLYFINYFCEIICVLFVVYIFPFEPCLVF